MGLVKYAIAAFLMGITSLAQAAPTVLILNQAAIPHAIIDPAVAFVAQQIPVKIDFLYKRTPHTCKIKAWPKTYSTFACYWREKVTKYFDHEGPIIFMQPTFSYTGARDAIGGFASVCDMNGVGVVFFGNGLRFRDKLHTLLAHELGHLLGADHDNTQPATFMHAAALAYNPLKYSYLSIREIRQCQRLR